MNYVGKLNEYKLKTGSQVQYEEGNITGPDHLRTFTIWAIVDGKPYPEGHGKNKKEAKENAAQKALEILLERESSDFNTLPSSQSSEILSSITQPNYQCWLNEHGHKTRVTYKAVESTRMGSTPHCCKYVSTDGKTYPEAFGKSKKEAKEDAARLVFETLKEQGVITDNCNGQNSREQQASNLNVSALSHNFEHMRITPTSDLGNEPNFIGMLNHLCQQKQLTLDYKLVEKRGPSHNPEFVYKVVMGKFEYQEGFGKTAKEARQHAAQLAWNTIQDQSQCQALRKLEVSEDESTPATDESPNMRTSTSNAASASHPIVFDDSPKNYHKAQQESPAQNKAKRKLAPNFNNASVESKEVGPNFATSSTGHATVSRFEQDFDSIVHIGKGGFGRVFKARNICDESYYAVKIVRSTDKARREVKALARLQHPNIVRYHGCWIDSTAYRHDGYDSSSSSYSGSNSSMNFLYIKMELCEGNTLSMWIEEKNANPDPQRQQLALDITKQIVKAVVYIHSENLIHRDLKPSNVMFGRSFEVKIGDFGLVTDAENDNDESLLERTKRTGTRSYMSPEQMNQSTYDSKVDIFALGLIYFELVWTVSTKSEKSKIWNPIRESMFPDGFCDKFFFEHKLIQKMLCLDPGERPDAQDLLSELENFKSFPDQNNQRDTRTV